MAVLFILSGEKRNGIGKKEQESVKGAWQSLYFRNHIFLWSQNIGILLNRLI